MYVTYIALSATCETAGSGTHVTSNEHKPRSEHPWTSCAQAANGLCAPTAGMWFPSTTTAALLLSPRRLAVLVWTLYVAFPSRLPAGQRCRYPVLDVEGCCACASALNSPQLLGAPPPPSPLGAGRPADRGRGAGRATVRNQSAR